MRLRTRQIILAFAKRDDSESIKRILSQRGFFPGAVCTSGAQVLAALEDYGGGVVICGFRLNDMIFSELAENVVGFDTSILVIANPARIEYVPENAVFLPMPFKASGLLSVTEQLVMGITPGRHSRKGSRAERTEKEKAAIAEAKEILMERHLMSEPEAHRYLQKCAMDNGCDLVETARMIMAMEM